MRWPTGALYRDGYVRHRATPIGAVPYATLAELFRIAGRGRRDAGDEPGAQQAFTSARLLGPTYVRPVT